MSIFSRLFKDGDEASEEENDAAPTPEAESRVRRSKRPQPKKTANRGDEMSARSSDPSNKTRPPRPEKPPARRPARSAGAAAPSGEAAHRFPKQRARTAPEGRPAAARPRPAQKKRTTRPASPPFEPKAPAAELSLDLSDELDDDDGPELLLEPDIEEEPKPPPARPRRPAKPAAPRKPFDGTEETSEILAAVDRLGESGASSTASGAARYTESDERALQATFEDLTGLHLDPLKHLISEVNHASAPTDWIPICLAGTKTVSRLAEQMGRTDLHVKLKELGKALTDAQDGTSSIEGEKRDALIGSFNALAELLPEKLTLDPHARNTREPIIVDGLLRQVDGVRRVTLRKLFEAGLMNLDTLTKASAGDIAAAAGVSPATAGAIATVFSDYKSEHGVTTTNPDHKSDLRRLERTLSKLVPIQDKLEQASEGWSARSLRDKKRLRRERDRLLLHVRVALTRLAEVDRLRSLDRQPVRKRLEQLDAFIKEARNRGAAVADGTTAGR